MRVGIGYDSHRFGPGGPLVLGGIRVPADVRLVGHSDGDAIAHALTDAILGAAACGDIGEMFSDRDPANAGRDSIEMLRLAVERVHAAGWAVHNADVTVVAKVGAIDDEGTRIDLTVTFADQTVLGKAQVRVTP